MLTRVYTQPTPEATRQAHLSGLYTEDTLRGFVKPHIVNEDILGLQKTHGPVVVTVVNYVLLYSDKSN